MEYWDLYDKDKNMLERKAIRGEKLANEEFHLVVNAWVKNGDGKFLISQRSANKSHPLIWECTGGSAVMGEKSIDAAIRELKEELNFDVNENESKYIGYSLRFYPNCNDILEVWLFETNNDLQKIKIQKEEVNDYKWATKEEILELKNKNMFDVNPYFDEILNGKY